MAPTLSRKASPPRADAAARSGADAAGRLRGRLHLPGGLRWRLTAWVAGVLLVCAAIVFAVVLISTRAQIRGQVDRDLSSQTNQLAQALAPSRSHGTRAIVSSARSYLRAQPFTGTTSTLLFVIVPRVGVISNQPELFGFSRPEPGESETEQAAENRTAVRLRVPRLGRSQFVVPDAGNVRLLERTLRGAPPGVIVGAGEPLALVEAAQRSIGRAFVIATLITLLLAIAASYLAGARVSAPLRRLAAVARLVDGGDLAPRMVVPAGSGREITVLADAFNHMLERLQQAFAGQRAFIADASHELRTPLTVIRGQLEVLAATEAPGEEEVRHVQRLVEVELTRMSRLVDDLLLLARAEQRDLLQPQEIELSTFVRDLWDGLSLTASRRFELGPIPDGTVRADPDRLAQALRNLGRNAIEQTAPERGLVRLEVAQATGDELMLAVVDDGPGIPVGERELVFERFHRIDHARTRASGGSGLGLAIVRAIAEAHGGSVRAVTPRGGRGARFELRLPGFVPAAG